MTPFLDMEAARGRGDIASALALALAMWRATRDPSIADAVDVLSLEALGGFEAPKARTRSDFHSTWIESARDPEPIAVGWLAATLASRLQVQVDRSGILRRDYALTKNAAFLERVAALAASPPDPRIARALVEVLVEMPFSASVPGDARAIYGPVIDALVRTGDTRSEAALRDLLDHPRARTSTNRDFLASALPAAVAALRALAISAPPDHDAWERFAKRSRPASPLADSSDLLGRIHRNPDDDGARWVYADWLQEHGSPRGEFIALSMAVASDAATPLQRTRANALLRKHKEEWLGDLGLVLTKPQLERGFLASAELAQNAAAEPVVWDRAARDDRLATVHTLLQGRGNGDHYASFVLSPAMTNLRVAEIPRWSLLDELLASSVPRLVADLSLPRRPKRKHLQALATTRVLPLETLRVPLDDGEAGALWTDLIASGVLARLSSVAVRPTRCSGSLPREAFASLPPSVPRFVYEAGFAGAGSIVLVRSEDGVTVEAIGWMARELPAVIPVLPKDTRSIRLVAGEERLEVSISVAIERLARKRGIEVLTV